MRFEIIKPEVSELTEAVNNFLKGEKGRLLIKQVSENGINAHGYELDNFFSTGNIAEFLFKNPEEYLRFRLNTETKNLQVIEKL